MNFETLVANSINRLSSLKRYLTYYGDTMDTTQPTSQIVNTYESTNGTLRVIKGLSSNTQMIYNGLILGMFRSSTGVLPSTDSYLYGDTTSSGGVECNIPKGFSDLTIALVNGSEVQITQTDNFQIMLFFELDNEIEKLGEN